MTAEAIRPTYAPVYRRRTSKSSSVGGGDFSTPSSSLDNWCARRSPLFKDIAEWPGLTIRLRGIPRLDRFYGNIEEFTKRSTSETDPSANSSPK